VTPLSDALTAAQRSALAALEKAYVAGKVEPEALVASLEAVGISDPVDTAFLLASLDVLREWGVSAPTMTERVAEAKMEPASDKQWALIRRLCEEKAVPVPDQALTKAQASEAITAIQNGSYDPEKWAVPF
jgi:hypothetical protein